MVKQQKYYNKVHKNVAKATGYGVNDIMHNDKRSAQTNFENKMKKVGNMDKLKSSAGKRRIKTYTAENNIFSRLTELLVEGSSGMRRLERKIGSIHKKGTKARNQKKKYSHIDREHDQTVRKLWGRQERSNDRKGIVS